MVMNSCHARLLFIKGMNMDAKIISFPYKGRTDSKEFIVETIKNALDNHILGFLDFVDIWLHVVKSKKK